MRINLTVVPLNPSRCDDDVLEGRKPPKDVNPAAASVIPVNQRGLNPDGSVDRSSAATEVTPHVTR